THEYVHSILHANFHRLPEWLDEGMADYYGATRFESSKIYVGAPPERVMHAQRSILIPLEKLITINPYAEYRGDSERIDLYYAECWALVHYFIFGEGMEQGKKLRQFFHKIEEGEEQRKAMEETFGPLESVQKALELSLMKFAFSAYVLQSPAQI